MLSLGASVRRPTEALAFHLSLTAGVGLIVAAGEKGSLADRIGLRTFDVVVERDGLEVETPGDLEGLERAADGGSSWRWRPRCATGRHDSGTPASRKRDEPARHAPCARWVVTPLAPNETEKFLARLEEKFGRDEHLAGRLRPIVGRIFEGGSDSKERRALLRIVAETYARHLRMRAAVEAMRERLVCRVNELYGRALGIRPHH